jgi:hypothetical protein
VLPIKAEFWRFYRLIPLSVAVGLDPERSTRLGC